MARADTKQFREMMAEVIESKPKAYIFVFDDFAHILRTVTGGKKTTPNSFGCLCRSLNNYMVFRRNLSEGIIQYIFIKKVFQTNRVRRK